MKNFLFAFIFLGILGIMFALPLTINSFTDKSPLYPETEQKIVNNEYTEEFNADFGNISKKIPLKKYVGEVEHIFTHALIAYPKLAYSSNMASDYKRDCITTDQFRDLLIELYRNNYILVDINSIFEEKDGKIVKADLYLPEGKKPLVMSFDDIVYDSKKQKTGMIDKLALKNGQVVAKTTETWNGGKTVFSKDEFVPILDEFVLSHPDFSFNGAKGTICLTGFDGILGYRTSSRNKINRVEEINEAKKVAEKLKETGWNFACHSFGHYHMKKISNEKFKEELSLWQSEVESIIGKTNVYVYPYGEWEIFDEENNFTEKHKMLTNAGFKFFCGVGVKNFFGYLPFTKSNNKVLFMDRTPIDGYTLTNKKEALSRLFDANKII